MIDLLKITRLKKILNFRQRYYLVLNYVWPFE
jgi:hypothetical protein